MNPTTADVQLGKVNAALLADLKAECAEAKRVRLVRLLFLAGFALLGLAAVIVIWNEQPAVITHPGSIAICVQGPPFESLTLHWSPRFGVAHYLEGGQ